MASFKAEVYKHQVRKDGTYPIKIRVIHNREKKYINTNFIVTKDDLTKSFKLKNYFFIDETDKIIKTYRDICNKNALRLDNMSIEQVVDLVRQTGKSDNSVIDIVEYGRVQVAGLIKKGKDKTAAIYTTALNNLISFVGRERIDINEITAL
jgi:hypothetical protein